MGLLVETAKASVFRPIQIKPTSISTGNFHITQLNGIQVEIQGIFDPAQLKQLLTAICSMSLFLRKLVLGIPAKQAAKITRLLMPATTPAVLSLSLTPPPDKNA